MTIVVNNFGSVLGVSEVGGHGCWSVTNSTWITYWTRHKYGKHGYMVGYWTSYAIDL